MSDPATPEGSDHAHLRLDALHRRIAHLEQVIENLHSHVGLGPVPERPSPEEHETNAVKSLLQAGREKEAVRLHRDLTGQGDTEARETLESLRAGF